MLKSDHRHVEQLFSSFEKVSEAEQKSQLAAQICTELMVHTLLEEEIFYPACRGHMTNGYSTKLRWSTTAPKR
jgi:hemerythrin superfamily protein